MHAWIDCRRGQPVVTGFSLVEMMLVIAVMAVLAGIALPALGALQRDARLSSAANEYFAALVHARSESIRRGVRVTLCTSTDGLACTAGTHWHGGWIVFVDGNANALRDPGETCNGASDLAPFCGRFGTRSVPGETLDDAAKSCGS